MNTLTGEKREVIVRLAANTLNSEEGIIFAYIHGSFLTEKVFHDIDLFVYTREDKDPFTYPVQVKEKLSDAVTDAGIESFIVDDFDVRIINDAPYDIVIDILRDGRLIADKDTNFRNNYIERISNKYRANYFVLDEANGVDRDKKRISGYLYDISSNTKDIENLFKDYTEDEIINKKYLMKSLKYSLVEISEAMSLVLQHILAKQYSIPAKGYFDTTKQSSNVGIISDELLLSLKPFFDFRNSLVHRYWAVDDKVLLENCRKGHCNFSAFVKSIETLLGNI